MTRQFRLVSGGTDNHLLLVDVASRGLTGKMAEKRPRRGRHHGQPQRHSLRHPAAARPVGRPHRHAGPDDARHDASRKCGASAAWIGEVLADPADTTVQEKVRAEVKELCQQFPAPANWD